MPSRGSNKLDALFKAEFGEGDLARRLWRGGLRIGPSGYCLEQTALSLSAEVGSGLELGDDAQTTNLVDSIEKLWDDSDRLRRSCVALTGEHMQDELNSSTLARTFLAVDALQPPLVRCIINKISEFGEDASSASALAPLLLGQLKWLDFIADPPAICESLLSIVPIVCPQMQRNIVESLPEILDDSTRDTAVKDLIRILEENPAMMGSVVDALGALGVGEDSVEDVNAAVLSTLSAANRDMLPASLRYLLRTAPPVLFDSTIKAMRSTLALPGLGVGPGRLCMDALRSGLRINKHIADHSTKMLRKIERPSDFRPGDIWIFLALLDSPAHRKVAEMLFKKKAAKHCFSATLLDASLAPFAESFGDLADRVILLASGSIKASDYFARKTGVELYALLFKLFSTGNTRHSVISALIEHTGSRRKTEINSALEALVKIAHESEESRALLPHSGMVQGLLDFLETFSDSQLRQIWKVLGLLCRSAMAKKNKKLGNGDLSRKTSGANNNIICDSEAEDEDEDEGVDIFADDTNQSELSMLEILIRKELTHTDISYRRIGVLGACTLIKVLSSHVRCNIFNMLFEAGRTQSFSQALAYDELAFILPEGEPIGSETIKLIYDKVSSSFESAFLGDAIVPEEDEVDVDQFPASVLWKNFDGPDVEVCIPIYRLVLSHRNTISGPCNAIRCLAPSIRLLCIMTSLRDKGSLEEIDAVIGAPLRMPDIMDPAHFAGLGFPARKLALLSYFSAHCWVVELVNGFSTQTNAELRAKCLQRLENLIELEELIGSCVARFPSWPQVLFDAYHATETIADAVSHDERLSGRGRKAGPASLSSGSDVLSGAKTSSAWRPYARQLAPESLALLKVTSAISWTCTDFDAAADSQEVKTRQLATELGPKSLHYLLNQLLQLVTQILKQDPPRGTNRANSLAAILLQFGTQGPVRKVFDASPGRPSVESISNQTASGTVLDSLRKLKPALLSLALQLSRSSKRCMPSTNDADDGDDEDDIMDMELHRKSCVLALKCLAGTLSASTMHDLSAQELLFDVLASIRFDGKESIVASEPMTEADIHVAAKIAFGQLRSKLADICGSVPSSEQASQELGDDANVEAIRNFGLEGCAAFLAGLETIYEFCSDSDKQALNPRLSHAAGSLIERFWGDAVMKSRRTLKLVPGIVRIYIQCSVDPVETVIDMRLRLTSFSNRQKEQRKPHGNSEERVEAEGDKEDADAHLLFGSLTAHSYHVYCTAMFEQYVALFKTFKPASFESSEEALENMRMFITGSMPLYDLARDNEKVLGPAMRSGRAFVEQFMKVCLPYLKEKFPHYRVVVVRLLKAQQKATRVLQVFCAHSKTIRDTTLTSQVPALRKSLELLLYRVKEMLQSHNETGAYSLGNLKNRDIHGEVVGSQEQYRSPSEDENVGSDNDEDNGTEVNTENIPPEDDNLQNEDDVEVMEEDDLRPSPNRRKSKKKYMKLLGARAKKVARPRTAVSAKIAESEGNRTVDILGEGSGNEEEDDEELVHSLDPPQPDDDDQLVARKRKRGKNTKEMSGKGRGKRARGLIETQAEEENPSSAENGDEDEDDGDDDLDGFLVGSDEEELE